MPSSTWNRTPIVQEVPTGAEPEGVMVSDDGKTVYVTSEAGDLVHAVDADSGKIVRDVVVGLRPRRFAATPDGKELWVTAEIAGEVDIIDRGKFVVTGKHRLPAAGHAQVRRARRSASP